MFVGDWPELLSEVSDLDAPADLTPYVMARINAAHGHPASSKRRGAGLRGRFASLPVGWFAAAVGGLVVLALLALAAHSREHRRPVGGPPRLAHLRGHGVEFSYPAAWRYRHSGVVTSLTSPVIDLGTQPLGDPCHGKLGCGWPVNRLRPGGVVLMVFSGGSLVPPTHTSRTIREYSGDQLDGLAVSIGCDRVLVGDYATPALGRLSFSACFRAPGLAAHEREFRAMLASARFSPQVALTPITVVNPGKTVVHTRIIGGTVGLRRAILQSLAGIGNTTITSVAITAAGSRYRPVPPGGVVLHFSYPHSKKPGPSDILAAWQSEMVAQAARDSAIERALTPVVYFTTPTAGGGRIYAKQVLPQSGHIPSPSQVSQRVERAARGLGATVHSVTILRPRGLAVLVDLTVTNPQAFLRHDWDSFTHRAFPNPPLFRSSVIDGWFVRIRSHGVTDFAQSNTDRGPYAQASWRNPHLPR
jgi:hypothetical protein